MKIFVRALGRARAGLNCIAPNAITRLGAAPGDQVEPTPTPGMDPALVTPMVAYLSHESCDVSGEVYVADAGRFARLFVG